MIEKRNGRKSSMRKEKEVRTSTTTSATGRTVEIFIDCEEEEGLPPTLPACLGPHKVRRLTRTGPEE